MIPWKLVAFILVMALIMVFVGFNIENRSDVSLVFTELYDVPVVVIIMATYLLGLLSALVLTIDRRFSRGRKWRAGKSKTDASSLGPSDTPGSIPEAAPKSS